MLSVMKWRLEKGINESSKQENSEAYSVAVWSDIKTKALKGRTFICDVGTICLPHG